MPPETIAGRYRIEREVGRGGMGSVWLATDDRLGRTVAIKEVGHLPGESVPDLARAMREARSSAALNHRNVVSVYDAIEEGDHIWLVMEYVPGRTLSQIVAQEGPMAPERAAWIGAQVADGLAAAHELGTVHRDVKPGNILVTDDDVAKISDFGIARTFGEEQLTQSGLMTGTPGYFSPELARGAEPAPASDVWALGATLYAAVEGQSPYPEHSNALAMLATIARDAPPAPERAGPLAEPISRMMDPDVDRRWGMTDCAHALHRIHASRTSDHTREQTAAFAAVPAPAVAHDPEPTPEPVPAQAPEAVAATTAGRSRTRRILLLVGAVALVVLVTAVALSLLGEPDDTEPAASEPTPTSSASEEKSDQEPTPQESEPAPEESEPAPEETTEEEPPAPTGGGQGFVADYYSVLPDDTETGWSLLSEDYQAQTSFEDYDGFWQTIDSVTVDDTQPDGPDAVLVTLTYTSDGSSEQETRRIYLERSGDSYLITDDEIV